MCILAEPAAVDAAKREWSWLNPAEHCLSVTLVESAAWVLTALHVEAATDPRAY